MPKIMQHIYSKKSDLYTHEYLVFTLILLKASIVKLLIKVKALCESAIIDLFLHYHLNVNNMTKYKKTLFVLFSAVLITAMTSCHQGTGCPVWTKAKYEQAKKKSV